MLWCYENSWLGKDWSFHYPVFARNTMHRHRFWSTCLTELRPYRCYRGSVLQIKTLASTKGELRWALPLFVLTSMNYLFFNELKRCPIIRHLFHLLFSCCFCLCFFCCYLSFFSWCFCNFFFNCNHFIFDSSSYHFFSLRSFTCSLS